MFASSRRSLPALVLLTVLTAFTSPARAWIEQSVRSDNVVLDLSRNGKAVVTHEILLRIRGGPLKEFVLDDVDKDAEPLPDATLTRAHSGRAAGLPIPLTLSVEEGRLVGRLQYKRGVRTGTYFVRVAYSTDLKLDNRLHPMGANLEVQWQGPRFDNGIDSMRVLLRVPPAPTPPALESADEANEDLSIDDEFDGVFLATLRRSGQADELSIVRPHVAKGERVTWRARLDRRAFDVDFAAAEPPTPAPALIVPRADAPNRGRARWILYSGALAGLVYGLLAWLKTRLISSACAATGARPRALLNIAPAARLLLCGLSLAGGTIAILDGSHPTVGGAAIAASLVLACHRRPLLRAPLRGPGEWVRQKAAVAFRMDAEKPRIAGRWFDAGSALGFVVFLLGLSAFAATAVWIMPRSAYYGIAALLGAAVLFPLFFTGRAAELPMHPADGCRRWLRPIFKRLRRRVDCAVTPIVRFSRGALEADEVRLLIMPRRPIRGLNSIEVGVESHGRSEDAIPLPFVIVRVCDASSCAKSLPTGLYWTRGRNADERVAVLRPRLPTAQMTLGLALRVVDALSESEGSPAGSRRSVATVRTATVSARAQAPAGSRLRALSGA